MIDRILDTVVSVVTPNGKSGVGVIRISGNLAFYIAFCILKKNPKIRFAEHCFFWLDDDLLIDIGVSVFFKSPNSFTGEDVLELYSHGNVIILESLVKRSIELGARLALNGEFSFRAFFNNKIDLLQAESINQLINSNYIFNNKAILNSLNGIFSNEINLIIDMLLSLRKKIEACIDFVEDFHICVDSLYCEFYNIVDVFMNLYSKVYRNYSSNNNFKVVIFGNVNVGKSSLFNLLLGENRSIVSDIPGTTRDFITSFFCHYGSVFDLVDTAGLNESIVDFIEAEGIKKTFEQINFSDVLIYVIDISSGFNKTDDSFFLRFSKMFSEKVRVFVVYNKIDVLGITEKVVIKDNYVEVYMSAKTGAGLNLLFYELKNIFNISNKSLYILNGRHFDLMIKVKDQFLICKNNIDNYCYFDIFAEDLNVIHNLLADIVGRDVSDELIFKIFSEFCIGK